MTAPIYTCIFKDILYEKFVFPNDASVLPNYRIVDVYTSSIDAEVEDVIIQQFSKKRTSDYKCGIWNGNRL